MEEGDRAAAGELPSPALVKLTSLLQGFRIFTRELDGNKSINAIAREQLPALLGTEPTPQVEIVRDRNQAG